MARIVFRIVVSVNWTRWREATTSRQYALCFQEIVSEKALAHHKAGIKSFFLEFLRLDIHHAAVTAALFRPKTDHQTSHRADRLRLACAWCNFRFYFPISLN